MGNTQRGSCFFKKDKQKRNSQMKYWFSYCGKRFEHLNAKLKVSNSIFSIDTNPYLRMVPRQKDVNNGHLIQ